jgi:hypothetical protein
LLVKEARQRLGSLAGVGGWDVANWQLPEGLFDRFAYGGMPADLAADELL